MNYQSKRKIGKSASLKNQGRKERNPKTFQYVFNNSFQRTLSVLMVTIILLGGKGHGSSRSDGSVPAPHISPQEHRGSCISKMGKTRPGSWGAGAQDQVGPRGEVRGSAQEATLAGAAVCTGSQQGPVSVGPMMRPPSLWVPQAH